VGRTAKKVKFVCAVENRSSPRHEFHNAAQSIELIVDAKKRGLAKLVKAGMTKLDDLESAIRSYEPAPEEAEKHANYLKLISELRGG
jgi:hypothetical protein